MKKTTIMPTVKKTIRITAKMKSEQNLCGQRHDYLVVCIALKQVSRCSHGKNIDSVLSLVQILGGSVLSSGRVQLFDTHTHCVFLHAPTIDGHQISYCTMIYVYAIRPYRRRRRRTAYAGMSYRVAIGIFMRPRLGTEK
jgi:hypothetical protein